MEEKFIRNKNFLFGFNKNSELLNGRIAMLAFIILIIIEIYSHNSFYSILSLIFK